MDVRLRDVVDSDLAEFFDQQRDPDARRMAAFTSEDADDRAGFVALWTGILANTAIVKRTIVVDDVVAGNIVHFTQYGLPAVGYWLGKAHWGRGIATRALRDFLTIVTERPLYARAAFDNIGSQRVLEKAGFVAFDRDRAYASARDREIDEVVLVLRAEPAADGIESGSSSVAAMASASGNGVSSSSGRCNATTISPPGRVAIPRISQPSEPNIASSTSSSSFVSVWNENSKRERIRRCVPHRASNLTSR